MDGTYSSPRLYVTALQNIDEQGPIFTCPTKACEIPRRADDLSDIEVRGEQTAGKRCSGTDDCSSGREEHRGEVPMTYETVLVSFNREPKTEVRRRNSYNLWRQI